MRRTGLRMTPGLGSKNWDMGLTSHGKRRRPFVLFSARLNAAAGPKSAERAFAQGELPFSPPFGWRLRPWQASEDRRIMETCGDQYETVPNRIVKAQAVPDMKERAD